jgi:adenylyltransferase/sulfurtransferase
MNPNAISPEELARYHRHLILPGIDRVGQERLKAASVLIIGMGGLGSPNALYLAAAGVGRLGLMDADIVTETNLQRQVIHSEAALGELKVASAARRLHELNHYCRFDTYPARFTEDNAAVVNEYDIIIDATDNFAARMLINRACVTHHKPMVYGAVYHFDGQCSIFAPHLSAPCYQCVFSQPPHDSGEEIGVFGVLPALIGSLQATETLKLILNIGQNLLGKLAVYNALDLTFQTIQLRTDPACPVCGSA